MAGSLLIFINTEVVSGPVFSYYHRQGKGMQSTGYLKAMGDIRLPRDVLVMHPNDGYDLGLLSSHNTLLVFLGGSLEDFEAGRGQSTKGSLHLKNDCALSTLHLNQVWWKELGKPGSVRLYCRSDRLLVMPG